MFTSIFKAGVAAAFLFTGFVPLGYASEAPLPKASYAAVGGPIAIPYGWIDFCGRRPNECAVPQLTPLDVRLTRETWDILQRVNIDANSTIEPISNLEHWGTIIDHWDYPVDGKGDCKIYALWKRKLLLDMGFPRQALLMTIVRDLEGHGHAILTVKTDHGDFILDNLTDEIRAWDQTGYTYFKRQAQEDPNVWLDLGGVRTVAAKLASNGQNK